MTRHKLKPQYEKEPEQGSEIKLASDKRLRIIDGEVEYVRPWGKGTVPLWYFTRVVDNAFDRFR